MDKNWKLQRYNRKDYSEVVEFPVEIVGRDGVVRRYTFEDSIRLYQRRITFAPIRYRDGDLVDAEIHHCRSRIDQLRRSYFHRFGWGTPEGQPNAAETFEDLAGEVAAFLCRVLETEGRPNVRFERLGSTDDDTVSTWFLSPEEDPRSMILYVHRFRGPVADAARDRFFTALRRLEISAPLGGDSEKLLAFYHCVDCGFVLTGQAEEFPDPLGNTGRTGAAPPVDAAPTPWDDALELIRRGRHDEALARCRAVVKNQPWHRRAYVAGAMVAMHLEQPEVAEELALVGTRYYVDDSILHYYLGVARLQLGRDDGRDALVRALTLDPANSAARAALGLHLIEVGAPQSELLPVLEPSDDPNLANLHRLLAWRPYLWAAAAVLVMAALAALAVTWWGLLLVAVAVGVLVSHTLGVQRQVQALEEHQRSEEIRRGLKGLTRDRNPIAN